MSTFTMVPTCHNNLHVSIAKRVHRINATIDIANQVFQNSECGASLTTRNDMDGAYRALKGLNNWIKKGTGLDCFGDTIAKLDTEMLEQYGIFHES